MIDLEEMFSKHEAEYIKFDRVENNLSSRPDLCAFLLLDSLIHGDRDIIGAASHDEFYLDIDCDKLAEVATEEDIITLIRCGVMYSSDGDLRMFA